MVGEAEVQRLMERHRLITGIDRLPKGHLRIETGFLYPDGSSIEVFLVESKGLFDGLKLSDLGQTIAWLLDVQVKPWISKKRQAFLEDAIRLYGVRQEGGALEYPLASLEELPQGVVRLSQACLRVADLTFTRRSALQTVFSEEVEEILTDAELGYQSSVELPGRYGKPVRVDFVVEGRAARSAVLTLASGNASQAHVQANEIFRRWFDLDVPERAEQRVTLFDDRQNVYRDDDLQRLHQLSNLLAISDPQAIVDLLAA
ncbi:MAG TPA: DUF1828 domain-containing protein [Thermoanaerobaculia bacterium]|nr:DUF1828 domain-containing protein [Thermoanaerobaculia bacterium]